VIKITLEDKSMQIDIGIVIGITGCILGVVGWLRNRDRDKGTSIQVITEIKVLLQTVQNGIDTINRKITSMDSHANDMDVRLGKVEEVAASAHKRLDEYMKRKGEKSDN